MGWFRKKPRVPANAPSWLIEHFEINRTKGTDFVVFDFETTGLNPEKDDILSFAFLKVTNYSIAYYNSFEGYLNVAKEINSAEIHQLIQEDINEGLNEEVFVQNVLEFIGNSILVGHHVDFDIACLNQLILKHHGVKIQNKTLDTAKLAARLENPLMSSYGGQKAFKGLDALCNEYHISPEARHSASGDTLTTAMLLLKLLKKAKKRGIKLV
ncbi:MAG: 3'-5' exonuclease [Bacteroidia bacterium]